MKTIGKPRLIRKINRNLVLSYIRSNKILTKKDLYNLTGLSKQTINNIVSSLLKKKIILESGYGNSTGEGGKKPLLLRFNENIYYLIGMLVTDVNIRCGVTNLNGKILVEQSEPSNMDRGPDDVIGRIVMIIKKTIKKAKIDKEKFLGIGIGLPGIIDFKKGKIKILTRFPEWKDIHLQKILNEKLKIPVVIDNEVNVRALGEKWFGLDKGIDNFITINTTEKGIGAGIIINNELLRGSNYLCGEVGHMVIKNFNNIGDSKDYKNFESILSAASINRMVRKEIKDIKDGNIFKELNGKKDLPLDRIIEILNNNNEDQLALNITDEISRVFGIGIANIICNFDPELIIVQGKFSRFGDYFYDMINRIVKETVFPLVDKKINIVRSTISKEMGIMGSASMVLDVINI